jgi:hypothetical protein
MCKHTTYTEKIMQLLIGIWMERLMPNKIFFYFLKSVGYSTVNIKIFKHQPSKNPLRVIQQHSWLKTSANIIMKNNKQLNVIIWRYLWRHLKEESDQIVINQVKFNKNLLAFWWVQRPSAPNGYIDRERGVR